MGGLCPKILEGAIFAQNNLGGQCPLCPSPEYAPADTLHIEEMEVAELVSMRDVLPEKLGSIHKYSTDEI